MSWFLENPIWIALIGIAAIGILGGGWVKTGRKVFLILLAIAIALTAAMLVVERVVKTDREAIRDRLHAMASDVQKNDVKAVLGHLHSKTPQSTIAKIKSELPPQKFRTVDVKRNLKIEVFRDRTPPRAEARFYVFLEGDFYNGKYPNQRAMLDVLVVFEEENGEWKASEYQWWVIKDIFGRDR